MIKKSQLIGAWILQSYTETDVVSGEVSYPMGEKPEGIIMYTPDGYMSAQLGHAGRPTFADSDPYGGSTPEYDAAGKTYLAYTGPFFFDEATGKLEHEMFVSFFPNWKGQRQVRVAAIEAGYLTLAPDHPMPFNGTLKTAELVWKRATPNE